MYTKRGGVYTLIHENKNETHKCRQRVRTQTHTDTSAAWTRYLAGGSGGAAAAAA